MQITLIQSEIEVALRNYIGNKLRVADGMEMLIELSSTRGANGVMATIDILETGVVTDKKPVVQAPVPQSRPVLVSVETAGSTSSALGLVEAQASSVNTVEEAATETAAEAGTATEATAEVLTEENTNTGSRSLFKGLNKPRNG